MALLAGLALAIPAVPAEPEGGALGRAAEELAAGIAAEGELDRVALAVAAPGAEGLAGPFATALAAALSRRGMAPLPLRGRDGTEAAARAAGADRLARVRVGLAPGARELAATAEILVVRERFFLQRLPAAAAGARVLATAVPADAAARALGGAAAPGRPGALALVPLFDLPGMVLALAVDEGGEAPTLLVVAPTALWRLSTAGHRLASRPAPTGLPGLREPAATVAVGDFGGGRIAWQLAGMAEAEVLSGALQPVASLAAAPLAAGGAGPLFGAWAPGLPLFLDQLSGQVDPASRRRSAGLLFGAAAAPRPGRAAFAVLRTDDAVEVLSADRVALGPPLPGAGAGVALADLFGEGEAALVTSSAEPGFSDRLRVRRALPPHASIHESPPIAGAVRCAAAGDLTGDGLDDVVLAAAQPGGGTRLYLLTADPREGAR